MLQAAVKPFVLVVLAALVAAGCSGDDDADDGASGAAAQSSAPSDATTTAEPATTTAEPATTTTVDPADLPPRRSDGCESGLAPVLGESTTETITSSGIERTYHRLVPAGYDATTPLPLVLDLHGYMEGADVHRAHTALETFAGEKSFVVLTPQGVGEIPYWNVLEHDDLTDDVGLMVDLIDTTTAAVCIDERRVYVTGLSMGAFMTSLLGCRLADRVAAIAPVAGLRFPDDCAPSRPVPVIAFHGTADEIVTYDGETGAGVEKLSFNDETMSAFSGLEMQAVPDALAGWAGAEGCADEPSGEKVSASVTLVAYDGCDGGSTVEIYRVGGGGHSWPGSEFSAAIVGIVGPTTFEIDANELMWDFFLAHPLPD